ncbi:MAG: decarboxylase [Actinomycetota bacterium]|nr:decarboxylase [Actinomycetota bacterium]
MKLNYNLLNKIEKLIGDSWYIIDIEKFRTNFYEFYDAFTLIYPKIKIAYSYKTNYIPALCKIINNEGGYAEVVSEMEYDLAIKVGVNPENIIVNGPYKPEKSLEKYLTKGSIVNLDNYSEFILLKKIASKYPGKVFNLGVRCNFELNDTPLSRFGFDTSKESFFQIVEELKNIKNIRFNMIHCHFPYRDLKVYEEKVNRMLDIYERVVDYNEPFYIDLGGGLGGKLDDKIKQQLGYTVADYQDYANIIATKFQDNFSQSYYKPILILEPGTALVANTMQYVCKVIEIKTIKDKHIAITSGSKINYHRLTTKLNLPLSVYSIDTNKTKRNYYDAIDISGYTCIEDDYLYKNYSGELCIGDYLVFDNVGSYSIVFKPPFIFPNVPIIALRNDGFDILKEAETFEYIFQTYNFE